MPSIGDRLKSARVMAGLTQDELASIAGISRISVAKYETGKSEPSASTLADISTALGVSMDSLMGKAPIVFPAEQDKDLMELRDELRKNPQIKILFDISKKSKTRDIKAAIAMLRSFEDEQNED